MSLIGSSGSGKSTLLRCANLLEDSQQGEILFEGEPIRWKGSGVARHPADRAQVTRIRTNLSMVFQQFNLWSHMTILQNVMEAPVTVLKRDRARGRGSRPRAISTRSGSATRPMPGRRSCRAASSSAPRSPARCAWSRARCCSTNRPRALDPELEQEVIRVIKDLAAEGRTMIIVTHDMRLAADCGRPRRSSCTWARSRKKARPPTLFGNPQTERLQQFLSPRFRSRLTQSEAQGDT